MEIEKRYELIGEIPIDLVISKIYIEQVYSVVNGKNGNIVDARIRKTDDGNNIKYYHTVKYKTDDINSRIEIESEISEQEYNDIFKIIGKTPLKKNRYIIPIGNGLNAEIDEFLDKNVSIIEVEFPTESDMEKFSNLENKPKFIGNEIVKKMSFSLAVFSELNIGKGVTGKL